MSHILTIGGRQFRSYFNGPVAYIVICIVMLTLGFFFWNTFFLYGRASAREMFRWLGLILVFALPALTMGLLAEEKRTGTIELLITMPVTEAQVIVGKFLGVLGLYAVLLVLTLAYPISVSTLGNLDWGPVWSGYLGLFLQGAAVLQQSVDRAVRRADVECVFLGARQVLGAASDERGLGARMAIVRLSLPKHGARRR
jgi:ABC-2 type transport system permease protein